MIEIVFGDSACGNLQIAQSYGRGEFSSSLIAIFVGTEDASEPTKEQVQAAREEAEERERLAWARAIPMGGNPADVFGFDYHLSIGDISEDIPADKRRRVLEWRYSVYPNRNGELGFTLDMMQAGTDVLELICGRILAGERVRVWYSNHPDELCGMYWFLSRLNRLKLENDQVILAQLPDWELDDSRNMVLRAGWGGIAPGDWHRYLTLQKTVTPAFCEACAIHWEKLQQENAALRAMINGRLVSAPETLYDDCIVREIVAQESEFHEAALTGSIISSQQLCISDLWIAHRIERMVCAGDLVPVTQAGENQPRYHRILKNLN